MNATAICRNQEGMRGLELDTKAEEKSYLEFGSEEKSNVEIDPKTKGQQFQSTINYNLHSTSTLQTHNSTDGFFIAADIKTSSDLSVFSKHKNVLQVFSNRIWDPGGIKSSSMFPFTHRNIL